MSSILLKSYAKINLTLKVLGRRPDGFHNIESIMQNVSLSDEVKCVEIHRNTPRLRPSTSSGLRSGQAIEIHCRDKKVPVGEKNTCYKAAELIRKKCDIDKGIRIDINKNIPIEAGLGGGSSNAAAVLIGLNKLWDLKLSGEELINLAAEIGSDVPFFMEGGRAVCRGRGEIMEKIPNSKQHNFYIIVKPDVAVSTKWAYGEWDKVSSSKSQVPGSGCLNDLEAVVVKKYPVIGEIKRELMKAGCISAQMTGSGSAVFGIVSANGKEILKKIKEKHPLSFLVEDVDRGAEIIL